ncbi:hypothetical protein [Amycolatopsis vastitatis]|uniref:hypothetical protein n=1 Tax=Amycolatopsis vastitatis TaxID=1905142 RepID=UPI0011782469|nr:hypothetical protein [Amycolatopsis vastitatis]
MPNADHVPRARRAARGKRTPVDWGEYAAAVRRWELITGRLAPYPTQPGRHGRPVLAPAFVEWLMGLPPGWATADHLDLPRTAQLRALGNGVMPQQAAQALRLLLEDLTHLHCTCRAAGSTPPQAPACSGRTVRPGTGSTRLVPTARGRRTGTSRRH